MQARNPLQRVGGVPAHDVLAAGQRFQQVGEQLRVLNNQRCDLG